jgi:hypothetical protein
MGSYRTALGVPVFCAALALLTFSARSAPIEEIDLASTTAWIINMSYTGNEGTTIYEKVIGFFDVDSFEISDITITGGHSYHIYMGQCRNGLVRNVTVKR